MCRPCVLYVANVVHLVTALPGCVLRPVRSLRSTINKLIACRQRNGIHSRSKLDILCAEADMYVARIDDKVM